MATSQRLTVFVPYQQAEATDPFAVQFARRLGTSAGDRGECAVLARREDAAGGVLAWADVGLTALPKQDQKPRKGRLPLAGQEDLHALLSGPWAAHDVLFLPQPYRTLLAGDVLGCAAPVVVRVASFAQDGAEYGAFGDIARRDIGYVLSVAQLVVFPTEALRRHAVERYGVDEAKTRVVPEAVDTPACPPGRDAMRVKYGLPERYLVCENGRNPRLRLPDILSALALLERRGGERIGLVSLGPNIDPVYNESWPGEELAPGTKAYWCEIPAAPAEDCHAILSHAVGLLARPVGLIGPSMVELLASSAGVPRLVLDEPVWDGIADLADQISGGDGLSRGEPPTRSMADVVEDYRRLFAEAAGCWLRPSACVRRRAVAPRPREQRVAWLINHTTLHDSEVPLLRRMGLEVYTSKKVPATGFRSSSTDYSDDAASTLPAWAIEALNGHDFYQQPFTPAIAEILNAYFAAIISSAWPVANFQIMRAYKGRILTRVFGREDPLRYCSYLGEEDPDQFWRWVCEYRHRYRLAACYDEIAIHEPPLLRQTALTLPVGIPEYTWRQEGTWTGTDPRVLFVCPYIKSSASYYGVIYKQFKAAFRGVPHWIAGDQPEAVADPCVSGYASEQVFTSWMRNFRVMYYHSREPRHIHYHPIEAIIYGMPVVYLRGGLMETFGGPDQPGACDTEPEARAKVQRLLRGDDALADRIRAAQGKILGPFREQYNEQLWRERFLDGVMSVPAHAGERPPSASFASVATGVPPLPAMSGSGAVTPLLPPFPARQEYETLRGWLGLPVPCDPWPVPDATDEPEPAGLLPFLMDDLEDEPEETSALDSAPTPKRRAGRALRLAKKALPVARCGLIPALYLRGVVTQFSLFPKQTGATRMIPRWILRLPGLRRLAAWCNVRGGGPTPKLDWWLTDTEAPPPAPSPPVEPPVSPLPLAVDPVGVLVYAPESPPNPDLPSRSLLFIGHGLPYDERGYFGEDATRLAAHWQRLAAAGVASVHPSEWSRGEAIRRHGFAPQRSYVLPLAPRPVEEVGSEEVSFTLKRFGLKRGAYWIHAGNFDPEENLITLFRVLEQQRFRGDRVLPLVLFGHQTQVRQPAGISAYHDALRRAAPRAGLRQGDNLHILPDLTPREHTALMAGAAGYLAPGTTSGQVPLPAMEAMGHRVPVLIGRTPGVEDHLGAFAERLLLLPPQEPGAWVRAMHAVTHQPPEVVEAVRVGFDWARAQQKAFPGLWGRLIAAVELSTACSERAA